MYSFRVVLVILMTRKKPLFFVTSTYDDRKGKYDRMGKDDGLGKHFDSYVKNDRLVDIIDKELIHKVDVEQLICVAKIAIDCLRESGRERPYMEEVVKRLQELHFMEKYQRERTHLSSELTKELVNATPFVSNNVSVLSGRRQSKGF